VGSQSFLIAEVLLPSLAATAATAGRLANVLVAGDLILFTGGIGSGKTTFIQGLAQGLGVKGPVTSPSFVIQAIYSSGRLPLSHVDLYRLTTREEVEAIGWEDYLESSVTVVEWADRYKFFDEPYLTLDLALGPRDEDRVMTVTATGDDWPARVAAIFQAGSE
jgi:tRNA threonylcarbamoyladenosine biosynthesis protein TsaE